MTDRLADPIFAYGIYSTGERQIDMMVLHTLSHGQSSVCSYCRNLHAAVLSVSFGQSDWSRCPTLHACRASRDRFVAPPSLSVRSGTMPLCVYKP